MFRGPGHTVVDKRAVETYVDILTPIIATFPSHVPSKSNTERALIKFATHIGLHQGSDRVRLEWAGSETTALRAMLVYVRRIVRQNGRGARSGNPSLCQCSVC